MAQASTDTRRTDTRAQIRAAALDLFAERGYDATSLREIADRLGVTKAAVYYHFRTKEEILASLFDDLLAGVDAILEWARAQEPGVERARGIVERYSALLGTETGGPVSRIVQAQQALKKFGPGEGMQQRFQEMGALIAPPGAEPARRLRARLALVAVHMGAFGPDAEGDAAQRRVVALQVAQELVGTV